MNVFKTYLDNINEQDKKEKIETILEYIKEKFPQLKEEIKWNQPMFSDHGTFIIGFSISNKHIAVAPESKVIKIFEKDIEKANYTHSKELFKIMWKDKVDFDLLNKIILYNIESKKDVTNFWR